MASTNYLDFGYSYGPSHYTGHTQHKRMSHGSTHERFHPYMRSNIHNKSLYEEVSNPILSTQHEPMYQQQYNNYFISPMNSYPNMTGDRFSTMAGSNFAQKTMYEDLLGLYSRNMEPIHSQIAPLQTLQDLCVADAVPGTNQLCAGQTMDKSRNHPFYWRKRSEPAAGMTRTRDKYRVVYTEKQRVGLEKSYDENKFITKTVKTQLSKELDLSERQIKIWFQNRRAKERRDSRKSRDTDTSDDDISNKDDNDTNSNTFEHSPNNSQFPTSCRFNENNSTIGNVEEGYGTGECHFMKHGASTSGGIMSRDTTLTASVTDYPDVFQSRHSISPTEWSTTIKNTLSTLNVSPLAINMDFGLLQRM